MNIHSFVNIPTTLATRQWQYLAIALLISSLLTIAPFSTGATEFSASVHKGDQKDVKGYSFTIADNFSKKSNFYWHVGYSSYKDLSVNWNKDKLFFDVNNVEAILSYRQKIKSYNSFFNSLSIEYQMGAAIAVTENKFTWPNLNEEKFFSEKGDINGFVGLALYYNLSRNTALILGVKYHPEFSEFGDMSSIYFGLNHSFGQSGY